MADKVALITGGARGVGAAVAREMADRGYKMALMPPSYSCEKLATGLGGVAHRGRAENAEDIQVFFDLAMNTYGLIDTVLNHMGHPPKGDLLDVEDNKWALGKDVMLSVDGGLTRHM